MTRAYQSPDFQTGQEVDAALKKAETAVQEAPIDGNQYARQDGDWVRAGVGEQGPAGPQGPRGAIGPAGSDGVDGAGLSALKVLHYVATAGQTSFYTTTPDILGNAFEMDPADGGERFMVAIQGVILRPNPGGDPDADYTLDSANNRIVLTDSAIENQVVTIVAMEVLAVEGGGVSDHGALTGLLDDDHTQYLLASGARDLSGKLSYASHPTFSADTELVDKKYVDDELGTLPGGHDAVTLTAALDNILTLSGQELNLDTQTANEVFAGPVSGGAAVPDFRALVADDIPDLSASYETAGAVAAHEGTYDHTLVGTALQPSDIASGTITPKTGDLDLDSLTGDELTADELAAVQGAATPSAANVFATMDDVGAAPALHASTHAAGGSDEVTVTLTSQVTGVLPAANGGTGQSALSSLNLNTLGSGAATLNQVPLAQGDGSVAWDDLSTVATTGAYSDLSGTPTLGTAAAQNVDAFATGAEGDLAATAVQPGDASPQSSITDLTSLTLTQSVHTYTLVNGDELSATPLSGGWMIIYVSGTTGATATANAAIEWLGGSTIDDINIDTGEQAELLLRSDGTTVFASAVGVAA